MLSSIRGKGVEAMIEQVSGRVLGLGAAALAALLLSSGLIVLVRPWLTRYALASPNARSSHQKPTPQGGGIGIVIATLTVTWTAIALTPGVLDHGEGQFLAVTAAAVVLGVIGAIDDIRSVPTGFRFVAQCMAVLAVIASLPETLRILPSIPFFVERAGLFVGGVWFVNLVNFMDGIDWMTVAECVPVTAAIVLVGVCGAIGLLPALVAAALLGAIAGFAPFNKPAAQIFLGDVGSLSLGLLLGWLLLQLVERGHLAAALILPLYYLADATLTLVYRIARRDPFWRAHRMHFYQRAMDNGFTVSAIVTRVFLVNIALAALALFSVAADTLATSLGSLVAAMGLVAWLLMTFAHSKR
jgi:UDP-N-acetylmuramyl pentapeptide phosphotransferase/UDP-N-acetylglucosamine-1-phosphate transferase